MTRRSSNFKQMNTVYKYLSHYYIIKRSVIFIVDTHFKSMALWEKAGLLTRDFFESMSPADHFGYISLGKTRNNDIKIEPKGRNAYTKKIILNEQTDVEKKMFNVDDSSPDFRPERLEIALERAIDWQNNHVDDE